jgi:hypothetical protein
MGRRQSNAASPAASSGPRFPTRTCHRRGCGRKFLPRSWNQRYCREPKCLRLLHGWQATKRQRERRRQAEKRRQHADAERERRRRQREAKASRPDAASPVRLSAGAQVCPRAWSRSHKTPQDFCDRAGCYDPLRGPRRGPAQYCGPDCAQAQRRVQDRERKFKARKQEAARRRLSPDRRAHRSVRQQRRCGPVAPGRPATTRRRPTRVRMARQGTAAALSSRDRTELPGLSKKVSAHDPKTSPGHRPRAPPSR